MLLTEAERRPPSIPPSQLPTPGAAKDKRDKPKRSNLEMTPNNNPFLLHHQTIKPFRHSSPQVSPPIPWETIAKHQRYSLDCAVVILGQSTVLHYILKDDDASTGSMRPTIDDAPAAISALTSYSAGSCCPCKGHWLLCCFPCAIHLSYIPFPPSIQPTVMNLRVRRGNRGLVD